MGSSIETTCLRAEPSWGRPQESRLSPHTNQGPKPSSHRAWGRNAYFPELSGKFLGERQRKSHSPSLGVAETPHRHLFDPKASLPTSCFSSYWALAWPWNLPQPCRKERRAEGKRGRDWLPSTSNSLIHQLLVNSDTTTLGSGQHTEHWGWGPGFLSFGFHEISFSDCIHSGLCEWWHYISSLDRLRKDIFLWGTILK